MKDIRITDKKDLEELDNIRKNELKKNPYSTITKAGLIKTLIKIYWEFQKLIKVGDKR